MPEGCEEGIIEGMYKLKAAKKASVQLLGGGAILREVEAAASILETDFSIEADIWSMTSVNQLRRDGLQCERWNRLNPEQPQRKPYVTRQLENATGPVICATDYIQSYGDQIRPFIKQPYTVLGTDGFGRSDTRAQLRKHFEVDRYFVVIATLRSLFDEGAIELSVLKAAMEKFSISGDKPDPMFS